jgi:hypothetical protein
VAPLVFLTFVLGSISGAFRPCRRLPGLRAVDAESVLSRDRLAAIQPKATVTDLLAKARGLVKVVVDDGRPAKQNTHPGLRPDFTLPLDCIGIAHGLDDHGLHAVLRRLRSASKRKSGMIGPIRSGSGPSAALPRGELTSKTGLRRVMPNPVPIRSQS